MSKRIVDSTESDASSYKCQSVLHLVPNPVHWPNDGCLDLQAWADWQHQIVALLQKDFGGEALQHIGFDDIDWPSWQCFYLQGKSPRAAIERALERDL